MVPSSPTGSAAARHSSGTAAEPSEPHANAAPGPLTFRDQAAGDDPVVRRAHAAHARWTTAAAAGWPAATIALLADQQHDAQERHLDAHHPDAARLMILAGGAAAGRLVVDRGAAAWHLVDVALVAAAQGRGIGGAVLRRLQDDARRAGAAVVLEVGHDNPRAEALYRRLGFADAAGGTETHARLAWTPAAADRAG